MIELMKRFIVWWRMKEMKDERNERWKKWKMKDKWKMEDGKCEDDEYMYDTQWDKKFMISFMIRWWLIQYFYGSW